MHEVLRLAGTGPERAVYIGDSDVDVQTGHNAGLYVIGVDWGFRGARELRQAGADRIVSVSYTHLDVYKRHSMSRSFQTAGTPSM